MTKDNKLRKTNTKNNNDNIDNTDKINVNELQEKSKTPDGETRLDRENGYGKVIGDQNRTHSRVEREITLEMIKDKQ